MFPGDERPFAVLGRELPLPDPRGVIRRLAGWLGAGGCWCVAQIGYPLDGRRRARRR